MRWALSFAVILLVILIGVPKEVVQAVTLPTLYDDFHGAQIDPDRWDPGFVRGYEISRGQDVAVLRLNMALQAYGNVGVPGPLPDSPSGVINLEMTNAAAAAAIGIQVTANVGDVSVTGCGSLEPSRSRARLQARLFRDGRNPPNPNDFAGVVIALNQIQALPNLPPNVLRAVFGAFRCLDFSCDTDVDLGFATFQDATLGQDVTLGIELDAANNRIIFTKDAETKFINNVSANQINTNLGLLHSKRLQVQHVLETCPMRAQGFIATSFENFRVKP